MISASKAFRSASSVRGAKSPTSIRPPVFRSSSEKTDLKRISSANRSCAREIPGNPTPGAFSLEGAITYERVPRNALAASMTQASIVQNEDTRRISAWVAIGVIPTIVAGLFGMNLGGIPGGNHWAGFAVVCALTAALCLFLYRRFKDADWL